jgi:AraC-like DNA-binding protein
MTTSVRLPSARLRPYISHYAGYRMDDAPAMTHAGLPSRHLTMVISLGGPIHIEGAADSGSYGAFVSGLHAAPVAIYGPASPFGVRLMLTPLGARALLGVSSADLAGRTIALSDLPGGRELVERLHAARRWQHRFDLLDEMLGRGLCADLGADIRLRHAWRRLLDSNGGASIAELASELGVSRRYLAQLFADEIGLAPKSVARIARFEHACRLIRRGGLDLAGVAAESGYADQPHLGREWVAMTGSTPRAWMRRELPFVQDYELGGGLLIAP